MAHRNVTSGAAGLAVDELLDAASVGPAGLIIEGDPGIGKTTLWVEAIDRARERGVLVLSSRPAQTESVLAYACLADLLSSVDPKLWADLPRPQRHAVDRVLLHAEGDEAATDRRAVAAAFLAVIDGLAQTTAVLLGVDDLQWVDLSSVHVLTFAARRITGRVGVLGAVRTSKDASPASWLQLPRPEQLRRIALPPLSLGATQALVADRLGRSFPRPTMLRIHQTSGGNPFYAMELARSIHENPVQGAELLPGSLTELVQARIGSVDAATADALLAASSLGAPTVDLVAQAVSTDPRFLVTLLEVVEGQGIISLDGGRIRFTHPLLERGVYSRASAADRRVMHRRLAEVVEEPELQARHLALAATSADPTTLRALDAAAETARRRGAPEASADLVGLAVRLGGETPERLIRWASYHYSAGDAEQARALLEKTVNRTATGPLRAGALYLLGVVRMFDDSFVEAAELLERALDEAEDNLALRVQTSVTLSFAQFNTGQLGAAIESVDGAVTDAERLGLPDLFSQALSMRAMLHFLRGDGFDVPALVQALELEDLDVPVPSAFRPSVQNAVLLACTGQLDQAHDEMSAMRRHYLERGDESGLIFIDFHAVLLEIWRGDFGEAALVTENLMERARQLGGDLSMCVSLTARAALAAYAGRVDQARSDAIEALAAGQRISSHVLSEWPVAVLGFIDVSLGNYEAALTTLQPQVSRLDAAPDSTEIIAASFVPDAVEAMVSMGQLAEVERLIERFERNGRRLDRPWMLAIGGRCRSMLLATGADIDGAVQAAEQAMVQHDRVPMPFERARTQLLLGQLQRRQRRQDAASATLTDALDTFERLDTAVWAERARAQLARTNIGPRAGTELTPSELRVAELAATGMTNRDMASALFISPKTVEANLSRVYRKLGIRSRAELGRRMGDISG